MSPEEFVVLFEYNSWANTLSLDSAAPLSTEQFLQPLGSSFPSLRDTLAHIYSAELIWFERFHGSSPSKLADPRQFPDLASLRPVFLAMDHRLLDFVRSQTPQSLTQFHPFTTTQGHHFRHTVAECLQHLANHNSYHRGQVATLLRQLGVTPIGTDLIRFYRQRAQQSPANA